MTDKQKRFIDEYCVDFCGAAAARRAGYSKRRARQTAHQLLKKPYIKKAIDERMAELSMSSAEATMRLTNWGRGTVAPFLAEDGGLDLTSEGARQNLGLVKKLKVKERRIGDGVIERRTELELHDAKDAVKEIAKIRGLYSDDPVDLNIRVLLVPDVDEVDAA